MIRSLRARTAGCRNQLAGCGRVPSAGRLLFRVEPGASPPLYVFCKLAHGFLRDGSPVTPGKRSLGIINSGKDLRTCALALLPQGQGFLHCVFFARKPAAFNCLADKRLLVGSQIHFHIVKGKSRECRCQGRLQRLLRFGTRAAVFTETS